MDKLDLVSKKIMINVDNDVSQKLSQDWHNLEKKINELKAMDTSGLEPMVRIDSSPAVFLREDVPGKTIDKSKVLGNAPEVEKDYISLPRVVKHD